MDCDTKKRKISLEQEEENEEEKIERFFGLVKSSREIRELLMMRKQELKVENEGTRVDPVAAVWCPTFRPEDFGVAPVRSSPRQETAEPSSGVARGNLEEKGLDLDLNLSL